MKRLLAGLIVLLTACSENSELYPVGGGAVVSRAPQTKPLAPPYHSSVKDPGNVPNRRETHAVANRSDCTEMERRFQQQGRRIKLVDRIRSTNPRAVLQ